MKRKQAKCAGHGRIFYMGLRHLKLRPAAAAIFALILLAGCTLQPRSTGPEDGSSKACKEGYCFMCEGTGECVDIEEWEAAGKGTSDCAMVKWDSNFERQYSCYCKSGKCGQEITPR